MAFKRKPDWILKIQSKLDLSEQRRVGAGWNSEKGHINIIIDFGCFVPHDKTVTVTLFKNDAPD